MRLVAVIFLSLVIFSCSKKEEVNSEKFEGKYKGTFIKGADTANVEIEFSNTLFVGTSDKSFPQICSGQVLQQKDVVFFSNTCNPSASLDYLSGNYYYFQQGNYLSFWKTLNGVTAHYRLSK